MFGETYGSIYRNEGFTLIELVIVVAILGVLAAAAVPNFMVYRDQAYVAASLAGGIRGALAAAAVSHRNNSYPAAEQIAKPLDLNQYGANL
jgi:type IV pilus assembly protein PilA